MTIGSIREQLAHSRRVLTHGIETLSAEQVNWRVLPTAMNISDHALHTAGFELVVTLAASLGLGRRMDTGAWPACKAGFWRQAGFGRGKATRPEENLAALDASRAMLLDLLEDLDGGRMLPSTDLNLEAAIELLAGFDDPAVGGQYSDLVASIRSTLGPALHAGEIDLPNTLMIHEAYHRGQALFIRYMCLQREGLILDQT